mmetsp:Transcript_113377/g.179174  ORF Transcript_113377/g.179174 Transcript_113377/m.179174 type:complete len:472 (+) Transcript_113377:62-1477(+)
MGTSAENIAGAPGQSLTAEASKDRIATAGKKWFQILDVARTVALEDLKKTYRRLCLLHHPDKNGGDADTFKLIQKAYEEGMKFSVVRNMRNKPNKRGKAKGKAKKAKPKAKRRATTEAGKEAPEESSAQGEASSTLEEETISGPEKLIRDLLDPPKKEPSPSRAKKRARPKPVPATASKAKLSQAIEKWDTGVKGKTMPDEVQIVTAEQAAAWLWESSCILVDVRPSQTSSNSRIPGALPLTYFQFLTSPEDVRPQVASLQESGKRIVVFSQDGASMGPCGLLGSLLLDIFGFDDDLIFKLEGGCEKLRPLLNLGSEDGNGLESALAARKELAAAREEQKSADAALAKARAELAVYDAASQDHLEVLSKGSWESEDAAKEHMAQLSPLLKPLELESSLVAMLQSVIVKRPPKRGPIDEMVFNELTSRFTKKTESLRSDVAAAAARVSEQASAVQAAQAEVDKIGAPSCPGE